MAAPNNVEVDMHKPLQALLDTILLAAGSLELGNAPYSPIDSSRDLSRRPATKPLPDRDRPADPLGRSDPPSFAGEADVRKAIESLPLHAFVATTITPLAEEAIFE